MTDQSSRPRKSIKGQILADFIVECPEDNPLYKPIETEEELSDPWTLFTDGSSCIDGFGAGRILTNPEGAKFTYALRFRFDATNNEAKYEALIAGLRIAEKIAHERNTPRGKGKGKGHTTQVQMGIDIVGPYPEGPGKVKFLVVAIDYVTKLIEAKHVATITDNQIKKFVWDNIVCRFGLPGEILYDNEKQFRDNTFKDWCEKLCIRQHFASVKHLQANSLVERANKILGEGINAWLDERSKNWIEEIPHVLCAHRTMIKSSEGDMPFLLTYETKVVIPAEIGMPTLRTAEIDMVQNDKALEINLDLLKERREQAAIHEAIGRNNDASHAKDSGKLSPKWEGPYEVTEALGNGAYKLRTAMESSFGELGISATSKNVTYMKFSNSSFSNTIFEGEGTSVGCSAPKTPSSATVLEEQNWLE
nr:reverse transcriptase domain-containing protein [Tanacetum cinerariifolium]